MELVVFVGKDRESWGQIKAVISRGEWEKVILVKSANEKFEGEENFEVLRVDTSKDLVSLQKELKEKLKNALDTGFEVALNIASGNGKEHMALLSALLTIPVGVRFVAYTKNGLEFIS